MGSESTAKFRKDFRSQYHKLIAIFLLMAILLGSFNNGADFGTRNQKEPFDVTSYESCKVAAPEKSRLDIETKPIWLPSHPATIRESVHKSLINRITGLPAGGKTFYASNKGLRQCIGETVTATCTNIHPIVEMNGGPDKKKETFYKAYIMALRNPMTALPAFIDEKGILYHGRTGQSPIDTWRQTRDNWIDGLFDGWLKVLREWKKSSYDVGVYLIYEDLMDIKKGPTALKGLRNLLEKDGFDTVTEDNLGCIWYESIGRESLEQHHKAGYEYNDYFPGYTKDQKEYMIQGLNTAIEEFKDDSELVQILTMYRNEIAQHCILDSKWTNSTIA